MYSREGGREEGGLGERTEACTVGREGGRRAGGGVQIDLHCLVTHPLY